MFEHNALSLVEVKLKRQTRRWFTLGRRLRRECVQLEFMVDGLALQDHVRRWDLDIPATQSLSRLNDVHPSDAIQQIDRLLGVIPHQYGERAWLLFCPLCADEGCGGLTTELTIQSETVSWSNFGWDINYEPDEKPIRTHSSSASTFERRDYEAVLGEARERFSQLL